MNIVDRYMCAQARGYHRGRYQLVAVTSLYMSIKVNEPTAFGIHDFAVMSHGTYSAKDIKDTEWSILKDLSWRVCPPTSLQMGHHILALMQSKIRENNTDSLQRGTWEFVREEIAFAVENSVREYYFVTQRPSTVAIAAILNVIEQVGDHDYKLLILSLLPILQDFDFEPSFVLKKAMDKLLCMTNSEDHEALEESCGNKEDNREDNALRNSSLGSFHGSCTD
eukprot:CAMPEP_0181106704 /NCGR_PEP_ID=MMETSP1071-20121207/16671_1 /TAXON_ID=35127 /ORGANISM="Thalassiosira sp., Strain NH16" /LENGTH=222 /DNA_ID=CAMNT_0023190123 /DNA_START=295 /DNA_END=960 /DNA_ORIENTATION=-